MRLFAILGINAHHRSFKERPNNNTYDTDLGISVIGGVFPRLDRSNFIIIVDLQNGFDALASNWEKRFTHAIASF